jgi:hypothetical protein
MIGLQAKTGIEATLERVFNAQGHRFSKLQIIWTGTTAGVSWRRDGSGGVRARFIMPALSDTATISKADFANLLGYVMHELGHCWYTSNEAWEAGIENASDRDLMHALINGLEDPRIEALVIRDQRATNSAPLFHALVESVLGNGYVKPDDRKNIPFMLAIEGRRLNGYPITVPSVFPKSPWSKILEQASRDALQAPDTQAVVEIAQRLYAQLTEPSKQDGQEGQDGQEEKDGQDSQDGQEEQDGQGEDNQDSDQGDDQDSDQGDGNTPEQAGNGSGSSEYKEVEPTDFINKMLKRLNGDVQADCLPVTVTTKIHQFDWSD